ncbi:uncharacterized protein LOC5512391 [Nematostella vectensis]|uniref:uncharacterized protein LOC5512391 n=1 Tax=Nematostella vectensis TaxID=45351 RepID=UPI002076D5E1|nr:uncharacterized protein LOC5512391 [Nematostella vectensis]
MNRNSDKKFDSRQYSDGSFIDESATTINDTPVHTPDGEELFSTDYVENLVESFWTRVDDKIDKAFHERDANKTTQEEIHQTKKEEEKNEKLALDRCTQYSKFNYLFFLVFKFILRIWSLLKSKICNGFECCWSATREVLIPLLFHRNSHLSLVILIVLDVGLIALVLLEDYGAIDGRGNESSFYIFQWICFGVLFFYLLEVCLKILALGKEIFTDKLELFDCILVIFYFIAEAALTNAFRRIDAVYPKYLHMVVVLRLWRMIPVLNDMSCVQEEIDRMESQRKQDK